MTHFQGSAKQLAVGNLSITFPLILKEKYLQKVDSWRVWLIF